jgi:hypothetical protein
VPGWNSGARVGTVFTDLSRPFKLADTEINALRTNGFRAHGTASRCCCIPGVGTGACAIDTTLFWRSTCVYASGSNSEPCAAAFLDPGFTRPSPAGASPCGHHWGLTSVTCGTTSAMGTSHAGEHVFVGNVTDFAHAYDGREGENPTVRFWVR